jgi:hypothetical protein
MVQSRLKGRAANQETRRFLQFAQNKMDDAKAAPIHLL